MKVFFIRKRTLYMYIGLIILLLVTIKFLHHRFAAKEVSYLPITNKIIGIDPGHGGVDPGAVSKSGILEDEINLEIALKLKRLIEQSGGIVIMTRDEDKGLYTEKSTTLRQKKTEDLINRKALIEETGCELFVSIHMNSFTNSKYSGSQTLYYDGYPENEKLASIIQEELKTVLDKDNRRAAAIRDDVYLIKELQIPSVLVEAGFLSNPEEEILLQKEEYQEKIAWAIYVGIMKYLNDM
ncbi:MAG: N-acetylmuramoyl-L-alanine amidase CwlD [Tissierellaceae bacterium]|nr:N-acetylmuramoyl-L-alanine amidase CwlD [Tissierellaceae bacterium]